MAANPLRTAEGSAAAQLGPVSEEGQARQTQALETDKKNSLTEYLRVSDEAWTNLSAVTQQIDQTYSSFLEQLAEDNPDLKGAFFGFSVNKDGTLFVSYSEDLNKEQIDRLNKALNDDEGLVALANDLADAQIAVFNAHDGFNKQKALNRDNYGQSIDMGIDILTRHLARSAPHDGSASSIHQSNWNSNWYNQI
ncbi:MAG: hypothetical protein ACMZI0_12615 [Symbiopectobacterium sp.]|uniref:hypothetical protein n=1 Tax=Symbiopectobacterium sp. TaxID=2952789 RepID=UPI0039EC2470